MVVEVARLSVAGGTQELFERAFDEFGKTLSRATGFHGAELQRGIERPNEYWLLVQWETVKAHTQDFKAAGGFARWDEFVGPYLKSPPDAVHAEARATVEARD
jgi:heme-degrading monooxygenase HmoA